MKIDENHQIVHVSDYLLNQQRNEYIVIVIWLGEKRHAASVYREKDLPQRYDS